MRQGRDAMRLKQFLEIKHFFSFCFRAFVFWCMNKHFQTSTQPSGFVCRQRTGCVLSTVCASLLSLSVFAGPLNLRQTRRQACRSLRQTKKRDSDSDITRSTLLQVQNNLSLAWGYKPPKPRKYRKRTGSLPAHSHPQVIQSILLLIQLPCSLVSLWPRPCVTTVHQAENWGEMHSIASWGTGMIETKAGP